MITLQKMLAVQKFCKVATQIKTLTENQLNTFTLDLLGAFIFEGKSDLLEFILTDQMDKFYNSIEEMNKFGE